MSDLTTPPRKKPGKINKFLQAYMKATDNNSTPQPSPSGTPKSFRKWTPPRSTSTTSIQEEKHGDTPSASGTVVSDCSDAGDKLDVTADVTVDESLDAPAAHDETPAQAETTSAAAAASDPITSSGSNDSLIEFFDEEQRENDEVSAFVDTLEAEITEIFDAANDEDLDIGQAFSPREDGDVDLAADSVEPKEALNQRPSQTQTKERRLQAREAQYAALLSSTNLDTNDERFTRVLSVMSRASALCVTPGTTDDGEFAQDMGGDTAEEESPLEKQHYPEVAGAVLQGGDHLLLGSVDDDYLGETDCAQDASDGESVGVVPEEGESADGFNDEVNFDNDPYDDNEHDDTNIHSDEVDFGGGSVIAHGEDDIVHVDVEEAPFDEAMDNFVEPARGNHDPSKEDAISSPEPYNAGGKSRFSRFSKAKLRFEKRKHVGMNARNEDQGDVSGKVCDDVTSREEGVAARQVDMDTLDEAVLDDEDAMEVSVEEEGEVIVHEVEDYTEDEALVIEDEEGAAVYDGYNDDSYVDEAETHEDDEEATYQQEYDETFEGEQDEDIQSECDPDAIAAKAENHIFSYYTPGADEEEPCPEGSEYSGSRQEQEESFIVASDDGDESSNVEVVEQSDEEEHDDSVKSADESSAFNLYSSTSININDGDDNEKRDESSFGEGSATERGAVKFSFYASSPIENSFSESFSNNDELINNSYLAEDKVEGTEASGNTFSFYKSAPMDTESYGANDFADSCAITTDNSGDSNDNGYGVSLTRIMKKSGSGAPYTTSLKNGCEGINARSTLSFCEKKQPGNRGIKTSDNMGESVQYNAVETTETENLMVNSTYASTMDASNNSPLIKKYKLGCSMDVTATTSSNNQNSTDLFTKEEIDSITSRQLAAYLTLEERKTLSVKVISEKMMRGYSLAVTTSDDEFLEGKSSSMICTTCDMPMLRKNGKNLESCVLCPILKKNVLKRIFSPVATSSIEAQNSSRDAAVSDARKALLDVSKRVSYYDRSPSPKSETVVKSDWYVEGRNAVAHARDVLADRATSGQELSPRIIFPNADDGSVEVQHAPIGKNLVPAPQPPPPQTLGTPDPRGRPPLVPLTPVLLQSRPNHNASNQNDGQQFVTPLGVQSVGQPGVPSPGYPTAGNQSVGDHSGGQQSNYHQSNGQLIKAHSVSSAPSGKSKTSQNPVNQYDKKANYIATSALKAIENQIEETKSKLLNARDSKRQILYSDLLMKLNGALLAVQKLEQITQQQ